MVRLIFDTYNLYQLQGRIHRLMNYLIFIHTQNSIISLHWRNNALLQLGFFGAFRRSELANIQIEQLRFVLERIEIMIPRSKTDQAREGPNVRYSL